MIKAISKCRICGNTDIVPVIDLGDHVLTGIFPRKKDQPITMGPLELVKCTEHNKDQCGLLQLRHSYEASELYGDHYGYRSSLNRSMVHHLHGIVSKILEKVQLASNDIALDIGSNDSTLLQAYMSGEGKLVGIDPAKKFRKYYPKHIELISGFFSAKVFRKNFGSKKARVVTSIAMFYDLESPMDFMKEVHEILAEDGIWVFEQSYMPTMLKMTAYDTICQEHFVYYRLKQIKWMTDRIGFKIINVEFNATNGGSFLVMVAKTSNHHYQENTKQINEILKFEEKQGLSKLKPYLDFQKRLQKHRDQLIRFVGKAKARGKTIFGYGASTKGNVILQFCGFSSNDIPYIAEVNEDKFGCFTPGTNIPIISESEAKKIHPDYFLVLPWHFKDNIVAREKPYTDAGGTLIFPLPEIRVFSKGSH
jgi:NDP-4-keto-2,6-dideoxyhexose 3-C-methyltransferase